MNVIADPLDSFHLFWAQGSVRQSRQPLLHLLPVPGPGQAEVNGRVGENEPVALGCGEGLLSGRHSSGLEESSPTSCRVGGDPRAFLGKASEDVLFRPPMGGAVSNLENVEGRISLSGHFTMESPVVARDT